MAEITFIARMTVKTDRETEFVRLCKQLEDHVAANEKGIGFYRFYKLREPQRYAIIESFSDESAEHAHMNSAKLAEFAPKISACLIGTWVREYFDPL